MNNPGHRTVANNPQAIKFATGRFGTYVPLNQQNRVDQMNRNEKENLERALAEEDRFRERQSLLREIWKAEQAEEAAAAPRQPSGPAVTAK